MCSRTQLLQLVHKGNQSAHKLELEDLQAFVDHVCVNLEKSFLKISLKMISLWFVTINIVTDLTLNVPMFSVKALWFTLPKSRS